LLGVQLSSLWHVFGDCKFSHIIIACNTAHIFATEIEQLFTVKPLSLIDLTVAHIKSQGFTNVGLLATPTTIRNGLYSKSLKQAAVGICLLPMQERNQTESLIRAVIAGECADLQLFQRLLHTLEQQGCQAVIVGCTELSVIAASTHAQNVIDPLDIAVTEIFKNNKV
jgi:aspartate racemase